ncbi:MAG: hypothetical protein VB934_17330 [Polyangiaceae bacterium]
MSFASSSTPARYLFVGLLLAACGGETASKPPTSANSSATGSYTSTSGSGGAGASGTTTMSSSTTGAGAGGSAPVDCSDLPLCDDFEDATLGGPPGGGLWLVVTPNCSGRGAVVVDDAQAHSGSLSVRVDGASGYCNHIFFANQDTIGSLGQRVYGRMHVYFDAPFGGGHTTFLAMKDDSDGGKDLRMGGQNEVYMWNRESDDATLPVMSPAGSATSVKPSVNAWQCIEFMIDGPTGELKTWVDGVLVDGLVVDGESTPDIDSGWHSKPDWMPHVSDIKIGWEAYGGNGITMWVDDIALDSNPIGCAP